MWRVAGIVLGLCGVLSAIVVSMAPQTAVVTATLMHVLSNSAAAIPAAALPVQAIMLETPAAPFLALLLPLALDRLLPRSGAAGGFAAMAVAAPIVGLFAQAIEPALLMGASLALLRFAESRSPTVEAAASGLGPPATGRSGGGSDGYVAIDVEGRIRAADDKALELLGGDPVGRPIARYLPRLDEQALLGSRLGQRFETELQHESSRFRPVEIDFAPAAAGERSLGRMRLTDISARAERLAELERLALHDALTGLPNRALFHDRVRQSIAAAERHDGTFAVMLLDLDRFKQVNDTLGHQTGDMLLQAVGPRLADALRKSDTLARLGGDEFAVLLPAPVDTERLSTTAERLVESMFHPFVIDGMSLELGVSVGAAVYPEHGADLDSLVHSADLAMYRAKQGQLGFSLFNAAESATSLRRLGLQRDMRKAIDRGDMQVLFQPKVAVGGWAVTGVEALLRWNHPTEGTLTPGDFLAIAEHTGLVMPLTLKVLNDCLAAQQQWRHAGIDLPVSINISVKCLRDREFPKILKLLLRNWQGRPDQLMLEIAEGSVMIDPQGILETFDALSALGVEIVLDRFGTGYSSLPLLQRLPITALKIDRTFVGKLFAERSATVVVRSVVKLAHGLSLRVIATGVESERAADHLAALGCDELQGYFVGNPMPAERLPGWLEGQETRRRAWR